MQRAAIERAAAARGDKIESWYAEKKSAKTIAREELQRLRTDVCSGKVRKVFIYRLDRLARSGIRDTFEVVEELRAHGCELVTVADGFDLNCPATEVVLAVMAWAPKMERLAINERISAARERLAAEDVPGVAPSGSRLTKWRRSFATTRQGGRSARSAKRGRYPAPRSDAFCPRSIAPESAARRRPRRRGPRRRRPDRPQPAAPEPAARAVGEEVHHRVTRRAG